MVFLAASSVDQGGTDGAVRSVAGVYHSDPGGVPRGAGKTLLTSYYGRELEGRPFDGYTAAHRSLPSGTKLEVSYEAAHGQGPLRVRPRPLATGGPPGNPARSG